MAISGSAAWIPSNRVRLVSGRLVYVGGYTQNKPRSVLHGYTEASTGLPVGVEEVACRLLAGQACNIDIRSPYVESVYREIGADHG